MQEEQRPMMADLAPSTTDTSAGRVLSKILGRIHDPRTIALLKGYASTAAFVDDHEHRALATLELHHRLHSRLGEVSETVALRLDLDYRLAGVSVLGEFR